MENPFLSVFLQSVDFLILVVPIVIPVFLILQIIKLFLGYRRQVFWNSKETVLLEISPPTEVKKSPAAMELFLVALHQTGGESTWIDRYIHGKTRSWFSLEIASIGGRVRFYIWTELKYKKFIESQLYSQYPGIEIKESEDYAQIYDFEPENNDIFGVEFGLNEPDPYPIKTYIDYALDKEDKEEAQVDPITPVLEIMSSLNPGESIWVQFVIRAHKKEDDDVKTWFGKTDNWVDQAKEEIEKIRMDSLSTVETGSGKTVASTQTEGQKARIAALEKSISKLSFDVGIRALYIADNNSFDKMNSSVVAATMKQFNSNDLNGFTGIHATDFDYPWEDFNNIRLNKLKAEILEQYKDRRYFFTAIPGVFSVHPRKHMVLNTEELATVFHFPGKVSEAPSLQRAETKKVGPPPNLPI